MSMGYPIILLIKYLGCLFSTNFLLFTFRTQSQLADVKKNIQEINWSRKNQQTQVGERLKQLESNWVGLVSKNYEIEQAILNMEYEYAVLKQQHDKKEGTKS